MVAFALDRVGAESVIEALTGGATPEDDDILAYSLARGWQFEQPAGGAPDPHTHPASEVTAGAFGTGDFTFDGKVGI
ncbi:MAG: hypothetical protein QQN63_06250, partial [Nitrosopumilus sp.]